MNESPDADMEAYLAASLSRIAARTTGVEMRSYVAIARENRRIAYGLVIAAGAILLLFFAICSSMVNNALSARIRAGRREIGTLRAVGTTGRIVARSYLWQLLSTFTWGAAAGYAGGVALCRYLLWGGIVQRDLFSLQLWPPLLFAALLLGICLLNINSKVGAVCRESITENIREL